MGCTQHELPELPDEHPVWNDVAYYLAQLCLSLILLLSLEKIVVGGGVMQRKVLYPLINQHLRALVNKYVEVPENYVVPPQVQDVGLVGALLLNK